MAVDRRTFLARAGATAVAGASAATASLQPRPGEGAPSALVSAAGSVDWPAVRRLLNLSPDWIHLASFYLASHPKPVRDAVDEYRRRIDENPMYVEEAMFEEGHEHALDRVRKRAAAYVGGQPDEIAFVPNTTTGLALVYNGLRIEPGQEVLTSVHDHYSHHESIRLAVDKNGATMRAVALHDGSGRASEAEMAERLKRAIGPKTRAVGVTWVHSSTGLRTPIRAFAEVVKAANAGRHEKDRCLLIVDGVHGFGCVDQAAASLGADFFVAGTHKWIFAPRGTGIVWARADAWPHTRPTVPSFDGLDSFNRWAAGEPLDPRTHARWVSPGGFCAFEHLFAMDAAFALHEELGRARVAGRIAELNGRFRAELAGMKKVTLHTPMAPELAAGIVCFEVDGVPPAQVVERLKAKRIVASTSPYAVTYARVAAGVMVSPEEVETTVRELRAIAS
jgi:selenocysteine lyase/cysteine desulfurase